MVDFKEEKQNKLLEELRHKEAEDLAQVMANRHGVPYADLSRSPINTDALKMIPEDVARKAGAAAFKMIGKNLHIGVVSPENLALKNLVKEFEANNFKTVLHIVSEASLEGAWKRYIEISKAVKTKAGIIDISNENIEGYVSKFKSLDLITGEIEKEDKEAVAGGGISNLLEVFIAGALATNASDIHIEPQEKMIRLRYRLDGVLSNISEFHSVVYKQILSRIKLVSGLKLNVRQAAQDGRFSIRAGAYEVEIRTSILPGVYGESIVMRVLNPETISFTFEDLGMPSELEKLFLREITKPNGLILLTGPTGSGKTTSLYAFLRKVNSESNKIITIEDPVEYHLEGINQTQTVAKKGYTFASGLRSALRQDPDIIMVGEIRDSETAEIAVNSALTGHLVFSTLHTNNAAGTIPRLVDLGINPKVLSTALNISIAQRLLRRLCPDCKKEITPSDKEKKLIENTLVGVKKKKPELPLPQTDRIWVPGGCDKCNDGYKGRLGIYEAILMDESVERATLSSPSEKEMRIAALPQGILDMREDGILKVLEGTTSIEELSRVIFLDEEFVN